ncbi:hypothetical protein [Paracoccus benzoatiresistens]|uniref:Transposase n=1 Tax=Paracoccus benzoatiresistens TaxID=2997341 RepID=A0ABT4JBJ2_9RHOB|nr:hypothetical protein [Paracoccus sp. EF6]MCZ0964453.1 hypothetical protein [Paracoccus sp. EF6]
MEAIEETDDDEQANRRIQARGGADFVEGRFAPQAGGGRSWRWPFDAEQVVRAFGDAGTVPQKEAELVKEIEWLRRELRIMTDLSRMRKLLGGWFPRRKWETSKKATVFFRAKSYEVCVHPGVLLLASPSAVMPVFQYQSADCVPGDTGP